MMIPFSDLKRRRFRIDAFDGTLGQAHDFYLTDENWTIRYLIARLGSRFNNRRVLLPIYLMERIRREEGAVSVAMTRLQIRQAAPIESKQLTSPRSITAEVAERTFAPLRFGVFGPEPRENSHLHSCQELTKGVALHAVDGKVGRVADIIIDSSDWCARYLVVQKGPIFSRKLTLLSVRSIVTVSVEKHQMQVNLMRSSIDESPNYSSFDRHRLRST